MNLSVIIPTYNENENIKIIIPKIYDIFKKEGITGEILVIDDDSMDGTGHTAQLLAHEYPVVVHIRKKERGLATAVMKGFELAKGDICLVMDADLSHPVEKIPEMISPIIQRQCDITVGSRYISGGGCHNWSLGRRIVSRVSGFLARGVAKLSDPTSGFMAVRKDVLAGVKLDPIGWKIVLEVVVKTKARWKEVPIVFCDRQFGVSKLDSRIKKEYLLHLWRLYFYKHPKL